VTARARSWLEPLVAAVAALAISAGLVALLGADPAAALRELLRGALGDRVAIESTLLRMGPLLWLGLAVALAFRGGIWNIGGDGQFLVGALAATALATRALVDAPPLVGLPLALAGGALAGALWAGIAAQLRVRRGVSEVLSTVLLNFIAALAVGWAVHGPLQEAARTYPQSDALAAALRLPAVPGTARVHVGLLIAALAVIAGWLWLFRSAGGLRLRAFGLAPLAARYAGVRAERETLRVLLVSGALAGVAGGIEATGRLFERLSPGYGFTAIAVALLARLHPLLLLPAAAFFAVLATGSAAMQRGAGVPSVAVQVIEALVILLSVGFALRTREPA
jgi:general nucleoside transport system permease protein